MHAWPFSEPKFIPKPKKPKNPEMLNILVAVDGSPSSDVAFEVALQQAKKFEGLLFVLGVIEPSHLLPKMFAISAKSSDSKELQANYRSLVQSYAMRAEDEGVKSEAMVGTSSAIGQFICTVCRDYCVDMLVVGRVGISQMAALSAAKKMLLGSVSSYCVARAPCTVIVARNFLQEEVHVSIETVHRLEEEARKERIEECKTLEEHVDTKKIDKAEEEERKRRIEEEKETDLPPINETLPAVIAVEELERKRRMKLVKNNEEGEWMREIEKNVAIQMEEDERKRREREFNPNTLANLTGPAKERQEKMQKAIHEAAEKGARRIQLLSSSQH